MGFTVRIIADVFIAEVNQPVHPLSGPHAPYDYTPERRRLVFYGVIIFLYLRIQLPVQRKRKRGKRTTKWSGELLGSRSTFGFPLFWLTPIGDKLQETLL
jgi:hypothetical protein